MQNGAIMTLQQEIRRIGGGPGARYPAKLRNEIVQVIEARRAVGASLLDVSAELGISYKTLGRWSKGTEAKTAALKRVEVVVASSSRALTLISPNGLRVEGAGVEEIIALMRA